MPAQESYWLVLQSRIGRLGLRRCLIEAYVAGMLLGLFLTLLTPNLVPTSRAFALVITIGVIGIIATFAFVAALLLDTWFVWKKIFTPE